MWMECDTMFASSSWMLSQDETLRPWRCCPITSQTLAPNGITSARWQRLYLGSFDFMSVQQEKVETRQTSLLMWMAGTSKCLTFCLKNHSKGSSSWQLIFFWSNNSCSSILDAIKLAKTDYIQCSVILGPRSVVDQPIRTQRTTDLTVASELYLFI